MSSRSRNSIAVLPDPSKSSTFKSEVKEDGTTPNIRLGSDWENDPRHARNWSARRKWATLIIVTFYALLPTLGNSMVAPSLPDIAEKYHITNPSVVGLPLSIYYFSWALGPFIFAPLSEIYGRTWILHITVVLSMVFSVASAFSPNVSTLIVLRFLAGISGIGSATVGYGTVGDLFSERERTAPMAVFNVTQHMGLFGPGPVLGGLISQAVGIRWIFITIAIALGVAFTVGVPFLRETYDPIIQAKATGDLESATAVRLTLGRSQESPLSILWDNFKRPIVFLVRTPVCYMLSFYEAILTGIVVLVTIEFPIIFGEFYGFHSRAIGLAYLGPGVGLLVATLVAPKFVDYIHAKLAERNGGKEIPEMHMPSLFLGTILLPVGLLWFGWSVQAKLHWMMPIIGSGLLGFTLMAFVLPLRLYLIEVFDPYSASAIAADSALVAIPTFVFPLFGGQMYEKLGVGGGNSLLAGFVIVILLPLPVWMYYNGEALRARSVVSH